MPIDNRITIDYYQGAFGPTVMIDTHLIDDLILIREVVSDLKNEVIQEFCCSSWEQAVISGINDLILRNEPNEEYYSNIQESGNLPDNLDIIWTQNSEDWETVEGLINGLIESGRSGHQYLTKEEDGILIELVFSEV